VVGSLQNAYATFDTAGRKINDPWPTGFPSSGFDLDAVGVIWNTFNSIQEVNADELRLYPNPASTFVRVILPMDHSGEMQCSVYSMQGEVQHCSHVNGILDVSSFPSGLYFIRINSGETTYNGRFIKID
jgi:hypothetical protein